MIQRIDGVLSGGGSSSSVSVSLRHGADISTAGTPVTSEPLSISSATGEVFSAIQDHQVPRDHWLWVEVINASNGSSEFPVYVALQLQLTIGQ